MKNIQHTHTMGYSKVETEAPTTAHREKIIEPKQVVVVGLGYVGLPLAITARSHGHKVYGVDISPERRELIQMASVPDLEDSFTKALQQKRLSISGSFAAVKHADIIVICVPTPVDENHNPDLSPVRAACEEIGKNLKEGQLVILESTVHPGTCEEILIPLLEEKSGLRAGANFGVAHCPERINPGDTRWPVNRIPRVVGGIDKKSLKEASAFYRSILDAFVYEMGSLREAEAVKVVENSFRDINIAFVNELAMSFSKLNIDVMHVLEGASTKPFGFMTHYPGVGVGGHCIPVDPYYLIRYAKQNGFSHKFLSLARTINEHMPAFTADQLEEALKERDMKLEGSTIALLGISYKANISDLRESPSFELKTELEKRGATVRMFDPHAPEHSDVSSIEKALGGASAAVVATAHNEFVALSPRVFKRAGVGVVVDGRNCLDKNAYIEAGVTFRGIGR